ncbi:Bug family tripartite tricarboxylate transporter substrate binding protein [Falsiroseomonas stagni]|uniref:Tripartite-type tricarboxylate transporter, receptor component TctC n=1 Tax=Falsiroseomonas stagni DSM 19981 TaxID=1123062 RepID=A0A1I4E7G1_9PROT|nr:tripartite tricarboxylate transporter substrate binding protein [Falsiroseomonas stagni]SFL01705.1 Tripartite-type tricarboxylate transporter, receptor component TctC [Falsiroseomonas stagni DSM 19981]
MIKTRRGLLAAGAALLATPALAQSQPNGPVTLVVPVTPSTAQDVLARMLAPTLSDLLGQPVVVENRTGASGVIGTGAVARAVPDGRMLLMQGANFVMSPPLMPNLPFDPVRQFIPIIRIADGNSVLAVRPDLPARDVAEFVALAKARPGDLDYGSPGNGTAPHMSMALFMLAAGIELNHIPYRGTAPALQDLMGRRLAAMVLPVAVAMPLARAGQLRLLAVTADPRWPDLPEVPTLAEAGYPQATNTIIYGVYGPAGLPAEMVARINGGLNEWLSRPATRQAILAQGLSPTGGPQDAFAATVRSELQRWADVVREGRIRPD